MRHQRTERVIGDSEGTWVVQSVRRVAFEERWDAEFALSIIGVPWLPNPKGSDPKELEEPVVIRPERPDVPLEAPDVAERLTVPRRIYITRKDLEKHGYTQGCPACSETMGGACQAVPCRPQVGGID